MTASRLQWLVTSIFFAVPSAQEPRCHFVYLFNSVRGVCFSPSAAQTLPFLRKFPNGSRERMEADRKARNPSELEDIGLGRGAVVVCSKPGVDIHIVLTFINYEESTCEHGTCSIAVSSPAPARQRPQPSQPAKDQYRVVVLGAARVGKTAIVHQFLYDEFPADYFATVEEARRIRAERCLAQLDIVDTSGSYRSSHEASGHTTADAGSPHPRPDHRLHSAKAPVVVVGNKCDMPSATRRVRGEVAETITIDWENGFLECSAKENINVFEIFKELLVQAKIPYDLNRPS
ncbi:hypothetical protein HPB52_013651 [Rhipicephalus sanguineus]|uniref:GTP-binding protein Rhes n=1 Tax=Rhipicephalus sanguineus TaxID=34632 RepID=A0A9D4PF73_RHISA|nr:hypothetical protein HPB52_013651 [Rhipicephalus sanguineus]